MYVTHLFLCQCKLLQLIGLQEEAEEEEEEERRVHSPIVYTVLKWQ